MKKLFPFTSVLILGGLACVAHAAGGTYTPLVTLPGVTDTSSTVTAPVYLAGLFKFIIALGGAVAVFVAILGGTQYVASSINPAAKNQARERIENALIGLALVLSSWLLLNTINPELLKTGFNLPQVKELSGTVSVSVVSTATATSIDKLNLNTTSPAYSAAYEVAKQFPGVVFTSGRRSFSQQASAMANNIVTSGDRNWISKTYKTTNGIAQLLQSWVDSNPQATTVDDLATGLLGVMNDNPGLTASLSKHLSGEAFDMSPTESTGVDVGQLQSLISTLGGTLITKEAGISVWHVQF